MTPTDVKRKQLWRTRIAVSAFFFLTGLCFSSWGSRVADIQLKLGLDEAGLGLILLAIPAGSALSLPIAGWLINRQGSSRILSAACLLYALLLPLIGLSASILLLVIALFFFGFVGNIGNIAVNTQAVSVEQLFGKTIMSSFHAIWSLAGLAGASIGNLMVNLHLQPMNHFMIIALAAIVIWATNAHATVKTHTPVKGKQPFFVKPDKTLIGLGIIAFCCMISEGTMYDWSTVYFARAIEAPPGLVPLGFQAFTLATTTGRFTGDWLAHRYGINKILTVSGILTASGLLMSALFPHIITAVIGFFLVGLGVSAVIPLVYSEAGRSKTMSPSMALAAVTTLGFFGFLLGPPLIGFIAHASGLRTSFAVVAVMGLMITVLARRKNVA
ncbi:MFS transporter [Chitinophaga horti]|uniref:MFS transporter n=1 Tax=Chitinophaga horti TaxID=2920382 RepID=A0ABY6J2Z1_9BACT|nr:MFS transporter [Chitinophaga horti]UYQ93751.1 MFS transporter [Chitinophaga horti]